MSDLISRQAAMEEISKQQTYKMFEGEDALYLDANDVGSVLASLPSAQPEIVYCKDCICGHGEVWLSGSGSADFYGYCGRTQLRVVAYDYCSYAKRRTDD